MQRIIKDSLFLTAIREYEVLRSTKNKNSNDPRGFSMDILRQVMPSIDKPITYVINLFLHVWFSGSMKISMVNPDFKAGYKS